MSRLHSTWRKARHAGFIWTARAVWKRGLNKVLRHPVLRRRIDAASVVDDTEFALLLGGDSVATLPESAGRHFLDDAAETAALTQQRFPDAFRRTIEVADAVCRHEFRFLGKEASFGEGIDWFWMPDGEGSWPDKHVDEFAKQEYYGDDRPADIKYPWELARHQYFMTLAKAYLYTGDEKYVVELTAQILNWIETNPVRHGIHWISEMEFGIRIISWSNAFWLIKDSDHFRENGLQPFLKHLYEHARYLDRMLTTHWLVANNHLIGETAGLFAFSVLFPQFPEADGWRRRSLRVFTQALEQQIFSDGVNREQATGYHRFVLDFVWVVVRLGELNRVSIPRVVYDRMQAMLEYEAALMPPDGLVPQVGDCDDGRGLFLGESVPFFDFHGWLAAGAMQYDRADFVRAARGGNEEALWLLGARDWAKFEAMEPSTEPIDSRLFDKGGHAILRDSDSTAGTYVFVRCGEFGLGGDGSCVHSHADILAPIIHWRGKSLTTDGGTFAYYCATEERDAFRSARVHSTIAPQGVEPAEMHPIFNWGKVPQSRVTEWTVNGNATRFAGETVAFERYTIRRCITLKNEPLELRIEDDLTVSSSYSDRPVEFRLMLAPEVSAHVDSEASIKLAVAGERVAILKAEGFDKAKVEETFVSPSYGVRLQTSCLVLSAAGPSKKTSVTLRPPE